MKKKRHYTKYYKNRRRMFSGYKAYRVYSQVWNRNKLGFTRLQEKPVEIRYYKTTWGPWIDCLDNQWSYYPSPVGFREIFRTQQERRENWYFDHSEEKELYRIKFRRRRSFSSLPTKWDDINSSRSNIRSWKDTHRCRKQWMKNL